MPTEQPDMSRTPSRASTAARETIEPGQAARTPPQSILRSPHSTPSASSAVSTDLQDHVQLLEPPEEAFVTLEYGKGFQSRRTISEQLLCRYSPAILSYCEDAKKLRKRYKSCEDIKKELASLSVMMTSKTYTEEGAEAQIMQLIERVRDHYPLENYQSRIKHVLNNTADDQFVLRNIKSQCTLKTNSKGYKDMVLMSRLRLLNHEGMLAVCDRLVGLFTRIEAMEKVKAETNRVVAFAQRRVRLPGSGEQTIQSFAAWLEHGRLHYETHKQLFNLYNLADRLQIDALSEECLDQLFDVTSGAIQEAYTQGSSLQQLLGYGEPDGHDQVLAHYIPPDNAVKVIFERVLDNEQPPARLSELVSILLAKHMDLELWEHLKLSVKHQFALQIVAAVVAQREVKAEVKAEADFNDGGQIKRENYEGATKAQLEAHQ